MPYSTDKALAGLNLWVTRVSYAFSLVDVVAMASTESVVTKVKNL